MRSINQAGHFFFHWRNALFPAQLVALLLLFPPTAYTDAASAALLVAGLLALTVGQSLRVATIGLDYIRRGGKGGRIYADRLVTGGIFAHCRNPMYTGNVLIVFGFVLIAGNAFAIVVGGLLFAFMYGAIVYSEETFLLSTFGDAYRNYCRDVPRWIVRPAGLSSTLAQHRFDWASVVIREYGTLFTNGLVALALLSWKAARAGDLAVVGPICLALAALLAIAYAAARYVKKTRRLRPLKRFHR